MGHDKLAHKHHSTLVGGSLSLAGKGIGAECSTNPKQPAKIFAALESFEQSPNRFNFSILGNLQALIQALQGLPFFSLFV